MHHTGNAKRTTANTHGTFTCKPLLQLQRDRGSVPLQHTLHPGLPLLPQPASESVGNLGERREGAASRRGGGAVVVQQVLQEINDLHHRIIAAGRPAGRQKKRHEQSREFLVHIERGCDDSFVMAHL